jgi:hypothetical protein
MEKCSCGNPGWGFECVCEWVKTHPGKLEFACEIHGLYVANKPVCNLCECAKDNLNEIYFK